ncbi:hypothetical protein [Streptomyces griseomycini]|uniref:Uncharacterized protein n=1 Tax=Streptomyces griseomycini TaxID=66895 RepID=A0A7W7V822_9ACTN|nr:hypothetical protein [Streptomyces griseomycini]MBB4900811.1 hypothetical protein [Streptomyces griseomycini]GGP99885.1 hypothetical protein GCM10010266_23870 [Streptomyces griseomycini]GGR09477.1 hypothetical protein GCM10015536_13120 [Streptomyces griseomycini]
MLTVVLSGVLLVVIGGCACVVWAARGGPRWARGVARATLLAGEVLRVIRPRAGARSGSTTDSDGGEG